MDKRLTEVAFLAGIVYFIQGALGVTAVALPIYLRNLGWSVTQITVTASIVAFPWVLKILYGLLSDCVPLFSYRRKSYLILFAGVSLAGWLALSLLPGEKAFIYFALILSNLGLAATDVITDGYIVENSRGENSHLFQSIAWGSRSLGAIVSGFTGGWLAQHWSPQHVFMVAATLPTLIILAAFFIEEPQKEAPPFKTLVAPLKRCFLILSLPNFRWFILLLIVSQVSAMFGLPFFFHMKEKLGFPESFLGMLMSIGWTGVVIASFFYARTLKKWPPKLVLYCAIFINTVNILSTLLIQNQTSALILVFIGGMMAALTLLPVMSVSAILSNDTGVEGTLFAVLMSIHNLGQIAFGYLGGHLYNIVGVHFLIILSAAINLTGLYFISRLKFRHGESPYHSIYKHMKEKQAE